MGTHRQAHPVAGYALAAVAASIGFSATTAWALCLFPLALRCSQTAAQHYITAIIFYLTAGLGLLPGIHVLTDNLFTAMLSWLIPSSTLAAPFVLAHYWPRFGIAVACIISIISPIGLLSYPTPLVATGLFFPGTGFAGLLTLIALYQLIYSIRIHARFATAMLVSLAGISAASTANLLTPTTSVWTGIDTQYQVTLAGDINSAADHRIQSLVEQAINAHHGNTMPVFPEAAGGRLTLAARDRLIGLAAAHRQSFLIGGEEPVDDQVDNVLALVSPVRVDIVYRQRMPAPWFMWRGGADGFFTADLSRPATFQVGEHRIGALICYEIGSPLLVLQTHWQEPDVVLAVSNLWWARETNLSDLVRLHIVSWSRLFSVPYVIAMNT